MKKNPLTDRQKRFVEEYMVELNAIRAAIRAGYSEKTASRIGPEFLGKTWVRSAIRQKQAEISQRTWLNIQSVLNRLRQIADEAMASGQ
ncbi:MAG: phage terminase small subunit [Desulfomicrobiaceae bacterium]|jgi:phage terminase small subunit|nr:phage terminase small subunit [Desulfomicrobiaceae bacterium]